MPDHPRDAFGLVHILRSLEGVWEPGIAGVVHAALRYPLFDADTIARQNAPKTPDELADVVARQILEGITVADLAWRYRAQLESFGLLRADSTPQTALRRFQQFLGRYVYGVRIRVDELPPRIRSGLLTGGRRLAR